MKSGIQSIMLACVALMGVFTTSCTDDALMEASSNYDGQPFILTASQPGADSRLALEQDGLTTMWEKGDKLVLADKAGKLAPIYLTCELDGEKAAKATFKSESGVPAGTYYVIYNYNENKAYGHKGFQSVNEINSNDDLVLWKELTIAEGVSEASIELQHLYAKVRVELKNIPNNNYDGYEIGMYSSKKGFPMYLQFTPTGLENAEYGLDPNSLNNYNQLHTYFQSKKKRHNIQFGYYKPTVIGEGESFDYTKAQELSALVLPEDVSDGDVYFYVLDNNNNTCYEIVKSGVKLKAGTSYKVELDMSTAVVSTLNHDANYIFEINNVTEWRHAAYKRINCKITQDLNFEGETFLPIQSDILKGEGHKISNVNLDWSDEDNVGLIRRDGLSSFTGYYALVSNLTLENVTFKGYNYVGAFSGYNVDVNNCEVIGTSTIQGQGNYVGGIVGANIFSQWTQLKLVDVRVGQNTSINGKNYVGGIVGRIVNENYFDSWISSSPTMMLLESCKSSATVSATEDYVGGIFGKIGGTISGYTDTCLEFSMEDYTFSLVKCVNEGNVTGRHYVGGIGGDFAVYSNYSSNKLDRVVLSQSCSSGKVSGDTKVGGILGASYASTNICYSIGEISATTSKVGGILGEYSGIMGGLNRIANCYSLATLSVGQNGYAGGIVGNCNGFSIVNSYYAADPDTYTYGGIVGNSGGNTSVTKSLTTLASFGINTSGTDSNGNYINNNGDLIGKECLNNVASILKNIAVINADNAYSSTTWPSKPYPWECVKFASFSADTDAPGFDKETIK